MPSELDRRMDATIEALAAGDLKLTTFARDGIDWPLIGAAPPALPPYFAHFCAQHRDLTFLVAGEERLTFGDVYAQSQAVARALVASGITPGDRVGIAMRNSPAWIALYMGVLCAGGIATLLNGWWQSDELAAAVAEVDCALILADAPRAARLAGSAARVIALDDTLPLADALAPLTAGDADVVLPTLTGDDAATILFTSGSTGPSKGALSDHRAVVQGTFSFLSQTMMMLALAIADGTAPEGQPATLLNLPLFHVTAEVPVLLASIAMGRKIALMTKWHAEEAMRLIEREQVTYFVGVPLMSFELATHPARPNYDLSSVADYMAGGGPRPIEHAGRIAAALPGAPALGYGLTETNAVGAINVRSNYSEKPGSTGRPSQPLVEIGIFDGVGEKLPAGTTGEIGIRSIANFRGYWNRPEETAAAFTPDRFFLTGDLGYRDADGYLFITDRKKDIIIRGGENISCREVEEALHAHPAVAEVAVFGLLDERFGEVPAAVVHLSDGSATVEALSAFLTARIAAFKLPARMWIAPERLPRLGTEKIDKVTIRAHYRALVAQDAAA